MTDGSKPMLNEIGPSPEIGWTWRLTRVPVSCLIRAAIATAEELSVVRALVVIVPVIVSAGAGTASGGRPRGESEPPVGRDPCGFTVLEPSTICEQAMGMLGVHGGHAGTENGTGTAGAPSIRCWPITAPARVRGWSITTSPRPCRSG
jgi:hypothetical protein